MTELRRPRAIPEREIALALVRTLAESDLTHFALLGAYDEDAAFISAVARRLHAMEDDAFHRKLVRVVRALVRAGALDAQMSGTHRYYAGEPPRQMEYQFARPGTSTLLRGENADFEAAFLIRRAYPRPEVDD